MVKDTSNKRCVIDIEADGLLHQATKMHCLVAKDIDNQKIYEFHPNKGDGWIDEALDFLSDCKTLIAHNGITFDIPLLKKLYGWEPKKSQEIIDTLVLSRHLDADRPKPDTTISKAGPHSVEAWGIRLGLWKPEHEDWSEFSEEMLHRCTMDVKIQHKIYQELCKEAGVIDPSQSIFSPKAYGTHKVHKALKLEHKSAQLFHEQEQTGCYFDKEKAEQHLETLDRYIEKLEQEILDGVPKKAKQHGVTVYKPFKKNGEYTKAVVDWFDSDVFMVAGPHNRIYWTTLNLSSPVQVKEWLYTLGWKPTQWNHSTTEVDDDGKPIKTSPKLTPDSYDSLPDGIGNKLSNISVASHRRSQISGWVNNVRDDHRIPAGANPQGTPTGRVKHRIVANVPKASSDRDNGKLIYFPDPQPVFFGTEMRDLFCASPGKVFVGRDASGLELRCFAHYINDPTYTDVILNGDIHTYNQEMAGLPTRDSAKTFILNSSILQG